MMPMCGVLQHLPQELVCYSLVDPISEIIPTLTEAIIMSPKTGRVMKVKCCVNMRWMGRRVRYPVVSLLATVLQEMSRVTGIPHLLQFSFCNTAQRASQ